MRAMVASSDSPIFLTVCSMFTLYMPSMLIVLCVWCGLTSQVQGPGVRDTTIVTTPPPAGPLQRMVSRMSKCQALSQVPNSNPHNRPAAKTRPLFCWRPTPLLSVACFVARRESVESRQRDGQSPDCDDGERQKAAAGISPPAALE